NSAAVSSATNRQKALGPDKGTGHGDDSLFWPSDFEAAAAARPEQQSLVFFSRCRRAPFTSTSFYAPFDSANADAIVNDELFPLVDGTTCYQPQNEQNIAINPTNEHNIVTASNDYRAGFSAQVYVSTDGGKTFADVALPGWD